MRIYAACAFVLALGACASTQTVNMWTKLIRKLLLATIAIITSFAVNAQTLEQQAMCKTAAEKQFESDMKPGPMLPPPVNSDFESHYNPQFNRCYMLEHLTISSGKGISVSATLFDVFEGHGLAFFMQSYGDHPGIVDCQLTPGHVTTHCKSGTEFDNFVAKYMGDVFLGVEQ